MVPAPIRASCVEEIRQVEKDPASILAPTANPSSPASFDGAPPEPRVTTFTTPPTASAPKSAEAGPRSTSIRSTRSRGTVTSRSKCPVWTSLTRTPSTSTRTCSIPAPRSEMSACAPPRCWTSTPFIQRRASATDRAGSTSSSARVRTATVRVRAERAGDTREETITSRVSSRMGSWAARSTAAKAAATARTGKRRGPINPREKV